MPTCRPAEDRSPGQLQSCGGLNPRLRLLEIPARSVETRSRRRDPMNKRSAMLIAAGLVLTLGIGGLAVSLGLTGPAPVNAADAARPERVVRVERRTVTVHRTADADTQIAPRRHVRSTRTTAAKSTKGRTTTGSTRVTTASSRSRTTDVGHTPASREQGSAAADGLVVGRSRSPRILGCLRDPAEADGRGLGAASLGTEGCGDPEGPSPCHRA